MTSTHTHTHTHSLSVPVSLLLSQHGVLAAHIKIVELMAADDEEGIIKLYV